MKVKRIGITEILRKLWLFSANQIENSESFSKQHIHIRVIFNIFFYSYYTEFFWFPNWGADDGYWENCWKNDGDPNDAVDLNDDLDDQFQTATTYLFDITTSILQPLVMVSRDEHYDDDITFKVC